MAGMKDRDMKWSPNKTVVILLLLIYINYKTIW